MRARMNVRMRITPDRLHKIGYFYFLHICHCQDKVCTEKVINRQCNVFIYECTLPPWKDEAGINTKTSFIGNFGNIEEKRIWRYEIYIRIFIFLFYIEL